MTKTILLTGGAGFIGSHTAVELLSGDYELIIADDLRNSEVETISRIEEITGKKVVFYKTDTADAESLREVFLKHDIEAVIHFAGLKAVGESTEIPLQYYRNNLDSTLTLLEVMAQFNVNVFIFSSSATVYGPSGVVPLSEDAEIGPCTNPYGWTKLMNEQILRDASAANPDLSVVLLRYFNPTGAHESGKLGEKPSGVPNNLTPYIMQVAAGIREKLFVFGNDYPTPDGTGVRDYIHVVDLAKGHSAALNYAFGQRGVETVNLGTGRGYSVLELVNTFERVNNVAVPYEITGRRPGDLAECYASVDKAKALLNWTAEKNVDDMCRDAWRWQQNLA